MSQLRVSILSDDPFFREGLLLLLGSDPSFVVDNRVAATSAAAAPADIALVDSRMERALDYSDALFEVNKRPYRIFLSVPNDAVAVEALGAGARGVVRKSDAMPDVIKAIRTVDAGSIWAPRHVVVEAWLRHRRGSSVVERRLSERESEVVRCVASGMSNKMLADHLGISSATVKAHLTRIFQKLGVNGRGELIAAYHGTLVSGTRDRFGARRLA